MKIHYAFQWICLGALFAPSAKRTNVRAPAHEQLREKQVKKQPPRRAETCFKKLRCWLPKWLPNHSKIAPGRPKRHKETPRAAQERPKTTKKHPKSTPRASQERFLRKSDPQRACQTPPRRFPPPSEPSHCASHVIQNFQLLRAFRYLGKHGDGKREQNNGAQASNLV